MRREKKTVPEASISAAITKKGEFVPLIDFICCCGVDSAKNMWIELTKKKGKKFNELKNNGGDDVLLT